MCAWSAFPGQATFQYRIKSQALPGQQLYLETPQEHSRMWSHGIALALPKLSNLPLYASGIPLHYSVPQTGKTTPFNMSFPHQLSIITKSDNFTCKIPLESVPTIPLYSCFCCLVSQLILGLPTDSDRHQGPELSLTKPIETYRAEVIKGRQMNTWPAVSARHGGGVTESTSGKVALPDFGSFTVKIPRTIARKF